MTTSGFRSDEYGETLDIINPANGKILTNIPNATAADVDRALQAAQRAFAAWRTTSPAERANALLKIADPLEADADRFAVLETLDVGKPIREVAPSTSRWQLITSATSPA